MHLGQSQGELRVVGADPVGAGERELETAAEGKAMDGRNAREGQGLELIKHRLPGAHQRIALLGRADVDEFLDVGAGDEAAALRRADDEPTGFCAATWVRAAARSWMTAADNTLVEVPGMSQVSQAMRSASTSRVQAAAHGVTPPPVPIRGS